MDQYKLQLSTLMHQMKFKSLPKAFNNLNYFPTPTRITRQNNLATRTYSRTNFSSKLPLHQLPKLWNILHCDRTVAPRCKQFKKEYYAHLLDAYKTNIQCTNDRCKQCFPNKQK